MLKFPLPVMLPKNQKPVLTQGFGPVDNPIEPAGPNGEPHFHYGIDIVFGTDFDTYGSPLVVPFKSAMLTAQAFAGQQNQVSNFIQLSGVGASGNHYDLTLVHISAMFPRASYAEGDIVALVGNNGLVRPLPTPQDPYAGAHLHLGLKCNGAWVNPLEFFDLEQYWPALVHEDVTDMPRLQWALEQLKAQPSFNPNSPKG